MNVFDRRYELMPRDELRQLQLERLQSLVVRLRRNVRRYREQLADACVESLDDLARLPMTTPEDMVQSFPYGMFATPMREVIRLHSTLGPDGSPLVIGHTRNDITHWARLAARQLVASGVTANDVVQISLSGRGAAGYVLGAELIGASVIGEGPSHIDYQLAMLQNYRPTMLITTPTNALNVFRAMESRRIDPPSLNLRSMLLSRPVELELLGQLRMGLLVSVQTNFGIEDVLDPGLCVECEAEHYHVNEDEFLAEVIDGELVLTTLCREAMPLLRYRTRVACAVRNEKCACGRTGMMLVPGGRLDGRLRVSEMWLYEGQIAEVLGQTGAAGLPFRVDVDEGHIVISIEMSQAIFSDVMWPIMRLQTEIESEFLARLGIKAVVKFTAPSR